MTYGHSTTKGPPIAETVLATCLNTGATSAPRPNVPPRVELPRGESFQTAGETGAIRSRYKTPSETHRILLMPSAPD